jgi:hypothetical protein
MNHVPTLVLCAAVLVASGARGQDSPLVPPNEPVAGVSQTDLSTRWWQWAWSFEQSESPVADRTGERCGAGQKSDVWFLAGTYGTSRIVRTCSVPAGTPLFFPLANSVVYAPVGRSTSCLALMSEAALQTNGPATLILELDGRRLEVPLTHRQVSTACFDLQAQQQAPTRKSPAAANGYYVALKPLSPGTHTLNFGAILPTNKQAVTYTLIVE